MGPRGDVAEYEALEVAASDAIVIKENVIAVVSQVLENSERPGNIGAAITDKDGFINAFHAFDLFVPPKGRT